MFLGFNERLKPLRQDLKNANTDAGFVRDWMKMYDKIYGNYPKVEKRFLAEKAKLIQLKDILDRMELAFSIRENKKQQVATELSKLRALKDFSGHEFLVDKGNTEFWMTFERMLKQSAVLEKYSEQDMIFLQSEMENLIDMVKEALQKEEPDLHALTFFELTQKSSMLMELPHAEKIKIITSLYENEFKRPMADTLYKVLDDAGSSMADICTGMDKTKEERINYILEDWIWK